MTDNIRDTFFSFLRKWWCSLLILPLAYYTLHQIYWALRYNIYFSISYKFPFPVNIIYFLLDNLVLIVHEAGHTFFSIFGIRFITILGGSLFQLLLPFAILVYFWFRTNRTGIQLSLFYLGFSWLDVAIYAADAGQQQLPLIGGLSREYHDWMNLLSDMNLLHRDEWFGTAFAILGAVCYLLSIFAPLAIKNYEHVELNIKF